jgi:hypothetical protein
MWGSSDCDFAFKPSEGRSGGLLTIWDSTYKFEGGDLGFSHLQYADDTLIMEKKVGGTFRL